MNEQRQRERVFFCARLRFGGGKGQYMRSCNKYETPEKAEAIIAACMSPRLPYLYFTLPYSTNAMTGASY